MNEVETRLVELCQNVIRQQSYSGHEKGVTEVIAAEMQRLGYDEIRTDEYGNLVGCIVGKRPGKTVVMDGHIDTVDISDRSRWTHDPFAAEIVDGKIYGRGTSDMKGAVSAMVTAAGQFAADCGKDFAGKVCVSCSCHEECFEGVATRAVSRDCKPDYVIIGEATHLKLNIGQRGRAEVIVETKGRTCHSANPEKGVNAVQHMVKLIEAVNELPVEEHPVLGKGILELTDIVSSPYPGASVVPGSCRITYDRRLLVGETAESVLAPIQAAIDKLSAEIPEFSATCYISRGEQKCWTGETIQAERFFPAWLLSEDHELVQKALTGLKKVGIDALISHYSFCTNGSHFCGEAGIPCIGFGPSLENLAHTIDEYIEIDQLCKVEQGYYGILSELLK